jgi:hypothetical protein
MKKFAKFSIALGMALAPTAALAQPQAQEKATVSGYLQQGYDVVHIEGGGGQFIFFILKKERTLVHCSVLLQNGETSSCRTIK